MNSKFIGLRYDRKISVNELKEPRNKPHNPGIERLNMAVRALKAGIWSFDIASKSLSICKRCIEIVPIPIRKDFDISTVNDFIIVDQIDKILETFLNSEKNGGTFDLEFPISDCHGSLVKWIRISGVISERHKLHRKVYGILEDISERKQKEYLKKDVLAIIGHELRTPLSAIKLYLQLSGRLAEEIGNNCISEMLSKADIQINKMKRMTECFLQDSLLDPGNLTIVTKTFNIKQLIKEVIEEFTLFDTTSKFIVKCSSSISVSADRDKISQVLQNLLSNAIKYSTTSKKVIVRSDRRGNSLLLSIKDFGIGINADEKEKVFDRFYRSGGITSALIEGYGIGLYFCRQIILKHNGTIWLKSKENKGSVFYFTLPLA